VGSKLWAELPAARTRRHVADSSVVFVGIAPHPPVMVPEVGGAAASEVRASIEAMRQLTLRVIASGAETVIIVSPHAPLEARAFVAYGQPRLRGDFANFRAPQATVDAPLDAALLEKIRETATDEGFRVVVLKGYELDHGTAVPLYFLQRNGWQGRVVALGYSFLANEEHVRFGNCLRRAAEAAGRRVAFVASGDLSHRLKPDAPAGFHPDAHLFDEEVVEALKAGAPERIISISQDLRRTAGECGYRSMLVSLGVADGLDAFCEVLHYEAPFGVGYLVAQVTGPDVKR
jgi:MEMO1 family protein